MPRIADSTFAILANGAPDSPPASGLRDHLNAHGAKRVVTVHHPLSPEDPPEHRISTFAAGEKVGERTIRLPSRPPATYPLDLAVPPRLPAVDAIFAFNNLLCLRGLWARRRGRAGRVVYSAVDFVPERFGAGSPLTRVYDALDRECCVRADARWEVSRAALAGRDERHGLPVDPRAQVVPIGVALDRIPQAPEDGWRGRRVAFIGHLVERQGVTLLVDALVELNRRGIEVHADIAGRGPLEDALRDAVTRGGLDGAVTFHGFLSDHREVEALLAGAAVATAPYDPRGESFTRYADPSKLKSYVAAGLPTLTTDVPPNAHELAAEAGAEVLPFDAGAWADAIERALADADAWRARRAAALAYAQRYDWPRVVGEPLAALGFTA